jgi:hypothetical protein
MASYSIPAPDFINRAFLLSDDKALVTRGFDSGNSPVFRVTDGFYIELYLNYHYLVDRNECEYSIVNKPFIPMPGSYYRFKTETGKNYDIIDQDTAEELQNSADVSYNYTAGNVTIPGILAREIELKTIVPVNDKYDYAVSVIKYLFETPEKTDGEDEEPESPSTNDPFTISRSTRFVQIAVTNDFSETPKVVCNSAKQPFDTPVMVDLPISIYTVNRKEYVNPQYKIDNYIHAINSEAFWGKPEMSVLVEDINAQESRQFGTNTKRSWNVTYTLAYNPLTWQTYLLDNGTLQLGDDGKLVAITDDKNNPVTSPYPLDGNGQKLQTGHDPVYQWTDGSPFLFYKTMNLGSLYLPNPYA